MKERQATAQRRNMSTDDKKSNRRAHLNKEAREMYHTGPTIDDPKGWSFERADPEDERAIQRRFDGHRPVVKHPTEPNTLIHDPGNTWDGPTHVQKVGPGHYKWHNWTRNWGQPGGGQDEHFDHMGREIDEGGNLKRPGLYHHETGELLPYEQWSEEDHPDRNPFHSKKALQLTFNHTSSYSGPGYYVVDKYGAPQDGPYNTYSLAIANLNGRDGIQFMDQAEVAPINEPFPPQFNTVMGSKKDTSSGMRSNLSMTGREPYHLEEGHARRRDCSAWGCKPVDEDKKEASLQVEAISDERISDAAERHYKWSESNGHDAETPQALRAHMKAKGLTRAEADGVADLLHVSDWSPRHTSSLKENHMSIQHREAELLERMARNPREAAALMVELEAVRKDARLAREASEEVDLANAVIHDLRTPVATYSHHTAATDWLGQDTDINPAEVTNRILTSASLWYSKLPPQVRADRAEFIAQAEGYFRREASQYGHMASEAYQLAMAHVDQVNRINHQANNEGLLPWSAVIPPLPPSVPAGDDMNTNHVPGPGNPGQPMPWSNDAEHAQQPGSPSTTEAMGQAGQVNTFYPNQDATQEPNDDGALQRQGASYATGPYSTPITDPNPFLNEPAPQVAAEQMHTNPAEIAGASSRTNLAFWPNQDETDEPNDDGADSYSAPPGVGVIGGGTRTATLRRIGEGNDDNGAKPNADDEIAAMRRTIDEGKDHKQRNFPQSRTASENFNGPKTTYEQYLARISEGATPVSREFYSGMAAAVSPSDATSRREAAKGGMTFHEMYGPVSKPQLAAYRKHNVSPADHDEMVNHFGEDAHDQIVEHVKRNSPNGMYQPRWGWQRGASKTAGSFGQEPQNRDDPSGSQIGNNPAAWNGGAQDNQAAYAQSGMAQSSLPNAPQGQMAQNFGTISDFPDTGPTEVNPSEEAMSRYSHRVQAGRPQCGLCGSYGHSEEAHDDDPLYANWTDTKPWGKATRDDNVWGYPGEGRDIGRPRVAGKNDKPSGDDGAGVDRSLYAQSPGGHQNQDNQSYSSDRHVNWTDMPQGPPEVSDHAAGGVPTSFLGTVPVQGYAQDAEHPNGEMWPWSENLPGSGAADVANVPTPGIQSQMATGTSWPQPNVNQDR